jgi:hypothetical protein
MIIDLASKKPKVGKGCKMKGGVWETAFGSKITKPASLIIQPVMSYKDAWGQGAFAWTPAQRLAWATNTSVSGSKTRAKGVTNLQVTQALTSKLESAKIKELRKKLTLMQAEKEATSQLFISIFKVNIMCALEFAQYAESSGVIAITQKDLTAFSDSIKVAKCELLIQRASNATAWGLSVSPEDLELMREVNTDCASERVSVALESALYGIN